MLDTGPLDDRRIPRVNGTTVVVLLHPMLAQLVESIVIGIINAFENNDALFHSLHAITGTSPLNYGRIFDPTYVQHSRQALWSLLTELTRHW